MYWELNIFTLYIKGSVVNINLVIFFNINKWLKALLANTALIKVALLGISFLKTIK